LVSRVFASFLLLSAIWLFSVSGDSQGAAQGSSEKPNVVLILGDDIGWSDFGFMGHDAIRTPSLDRLASEGALFPSAYVPTPKCRASHATVLTGLYAHEHRICANDLKSKTYVTRLNTLPRLLAEAGYSSFQAGKVWDGGFSNVGVTSGMTIRSGAPTWIIGRKTLKPIFRFIDRNVGRPFFVYYAPWMPHVPHTPPERLLRKYRGIARDLHEAKYWAMMEWFDETCGQLLDHLDKKGLRDKTLVVFAVDNGWLRSDYVWSANSVVVNYRAKDSPYDMGVRYPMIFRWTGRIKPSVIEEPVSSLDILPTVLKFCGLRPPEKLSGISLAERILDNTRLDRSAVFGEVYAHTDVSGPHPELLPDALWMREGDWKLIEKISPAGRSYELYDLKKDPFEKKDLAQANPKLLNRLKGRLETWSGTFLK